MKKYLLLETGSGHTHTVELDSDGDGISSVNSGHSHKVENKVALPAFNTDGHVHNMKRFEGFGGLSGSVFSYSKLLVLLVFLLVFFYLTILN